MRMLPVRRCLWIDAHACLSGCRACASTAIAARSLCARSWSGRQYLRPCATLCRDFCRACSGACTHTSEVVGSAPVAAMDQAVIRYCLPLLRTPATSRACTQASACGWAGTPQHTDPGKCPLLFN